MRNVRLDGRESATGWDGHVLIAVDDADFEQNLNYLLQQVSLFIAETFPERHEEISLVFREGGLHQQ